MLIYFVAALPYTFMVPLSEKAETAMQVVNDVGIMQTYAATFLSEIFPVSAIYLSRPVLVLAYTIWSAALIAKYFFQNTVKGSFSKPEFYAKMDNSFAGICSAFILKSYLADYPYL
jgi:hypothetical protein